MINRAHIHTCIRTTNYAYTTSELHLRVSNDNERVELMHGKKISVQRRGRRNGEIDVVKRPVQWRG